MSEVYAASVIVVPLLPTIALAAILTALAAAFVVHRRRGAGRA